MTWQAGIPAAATLLAAFIAAAVAILLKRRDSRAPTYDQHTEGRIRAFNNLIAAADTFQHARGMLYLSQTLSSKYTYADDKRRADLILAAARFHRGCDLMDIHVADRKSVQPVMDYYRWVLLTVHPASCAPGVREYERLRDLLYEALRLTNSLARKIHDRRKPTRAELEAEAASRRLIDEGTHEHSYDPYLKTETRTLTGEAMMESVRRMGAELDAYKANVELTRTRMQEWEREGL